MKRRALSRERIVEAALALVEKEGLAGLSMRNLGRMLGCEAMSLYHFFPSKQHLTDALVEHAIGSVEFPEASLPALERLHAVCHAYRRMARRHARLFPLVAVHRLNNEAGVRFIERILAIIREAAGDDERAARIFRAVGYYLVGAAIDETAGYAQGPSAAEPVSGEFIARECPNLARAAPFFQAKEWDRTFELGLEAIFAGLEAVTKPRRAPSRRRPR